MGDRRFSAFYARIKSRNNKSIEEIYQASKKFQDGSTNLTWRQAKGKHPINYDEVKILYSKLWDEYIKENPNLIGDLIKANGLSDVYGQQNSVCQATELWRIRNEFLTPNKI